jgi:hypothetical protein
VPALDLLLIGARVIVLDHPQPELGKVHEHEAFNDAYSQRKADLAIIIPILGAIGFSGPRFRQKAT